MAEFTEEYHAFLGDLKTVREGDLDRYNSHRNSLIRFLEIGQVKLPSLHLDAEDVNGDSTSPADGSPVTGWTDLSRNNNHAGRVDGSQVIYHSGDNPKAFLRFENGARLEVPESLVQDDFSIAVVFRGHIENGNGEKTFSLVSGRGAGGEAFSLSFDGNGDLTGQVGDENVTIESVPDLFHLALFIRDQETGELALYVDGMLSVISRTGEPGSPFNLVSFSSGPKRRERSAIWERLLSSTLF